ncbi:hypothetical protein phiRKBJ001_5 [Streptomyces phage phiRKBJ001]|nr:hypothetical protein phiRKBJ001_5 [Streptomyces phage phiRKBJ001]
MRTCVLFGKQYMWVRGADGKLMLVGEATFSNVPQRVVLGPDIVEVAPTDDGWRRFERR